MLVEQKNGSISDLDIGVIQNALRSSKDTSEIRGRPKSDDAEQFQLSFSKQNSSLSPNAGEEDLQILPFEKISLFYEEYLSQCSSEGKTADQYAGKETFRVVFKKLHKEGRLRFARGKGTFPTCDICNNANDMLSNQRAL